MNVDALKVVFRTESTFISAGLELDETQRAFALFYVYGPKSTKDVIGRERMEMDVRFLQKVNESEYLYRKLVELPKRSQFGTVTTREA